MLFVLFIARRPILQRVPLIYVHPYRRRIALPHADRNPHIKRPWLTPFHASASRMLLISGARYIQIDTRELVEHSRNGFVIVARFAERDDIISKPRPLIELSFVICLCSNRDALGALLRDNRVFQMQTSE